MSAAGLLPNSVGKLEVAMARALDEESIGDSWVEVAPPSRGSITSSVEAMLLIEAQKSNTSSTKGSRHSPKSLQSPNVEFESLETVKYRLARDMLPPGRNTDWIWDWSSRPEAVPPKGVRFRGGVSGSALTTPPNSPAPSAERAFALSVRHSKLVGSVFFRVEVIVGLFVSNVVSLLFGACVGFFICKRILHKPSFD